MFGRDPVNRDTWIESIGTVEGEHSGMIAIIRIFGDHDRRIVVDDLPNLGTESQIDRSHTDL